MSISIRKATRSRSGMARAVLIVGLLVATPLVVVTATQAPFAAPAEAAGDPVLAAGGDIACPPGAKVDAGHCGQGKSGAVVTTINPDYVLPLGDEQYDSGTPAEYAGAYNVTGWGTAKGISYPAAGNHEYRTAGATGYFGYFGANAGNPQKGYYSWNVPVPGAAPWHMIALNSECAELGGGSITAGCSAGSTQEAWLKADLAANKNLCTIAYWHRPRFSSSTTTPSSTTYSAFWNDLYAAGVDVVLNGHAHDYERFGPQTSAGVAVPNGPTEFIVGTGGEDFQTMGPGIANSVVRNASAFGAMKLTLHATSYDFQFVPATGYTLSDSGANLPCHTAPTADTTKPSAATNVTAASSSASQVNLSWTAATDNVGVTNYRIYRGSNGATPTLLTSTTTNATTFIDTSVTAVTPYTYQVYAQDASGNIGPASNTASVTTPTSTDTTPPTAPTGLSAEGVASNEIDLGWTGSTDSGTGVSGYKVYRQGPGESTFTLLATQLGSGAGNNSYVDTAVNPSSTYQYYVTAYDGGNNESAHSNTISSSTPTGATSDTFTFPTTGDATIQQAKPTTTGGATSPLTVDNSPVNDAILKFNVAAAGCATLTSAELTLKNNANGSVKGGDIYTTGSNWTESTVDWANAPTRGALLNSLGAVASGATVTVDVTQGISTLNGEADFRIGSTSSDGVTYQSKEGTTKPKLTVTCATSAPVPDTTPPSAPASLTGSAKNSGEANLSWTAATDNLGVTNYDIYRGSTLVGTVPGSSLTYQDTTVAPSTTYSYTVKARDAASNSSPASNTATVTTPAATAAPNPPTGLTAAAASGTSVNLAWAASTSSNVTGYNIYRGPHGGTLTKISSSGTSPFTDTTAAAGTAYDYAVTAVATGGAESAKSNAASVTTPGGGGVGGTITAGTASVTKVTTAATTWTVTLPTSAAGNFMVIWLGNNIGSTAGTATAPGWTSQTSTNESSGLKGSFLTRSTVAGDPSSITVTWGTATLGVAEATAFTGVNTTTPVEVKGGQAEASATAVTAHITPSVTTTTTTGDVLVSGFTTNNASTWTASDTELADAAAGAVSASMYYSTPVAAGSYSRTATATIGSVKAVSAVLALKAG